MAVLGLCHETVVLGWALHDGERPLVEVWLRVKARRRGRCGRCGELASFYDQGGGERRWRHVDVGFATCELIADARRVDCPGVARRSPSSRGPVTTRRSPGPSRISSCTT